MTLSTIDDTTIDERKFVVALARGLDLLRAFRPGETMLGNRDFAERTGLPKATVNRLAYTLTVLGYLRYDETLGKYALDAGVLSLGYALLSGSGTIDLARPHMQALAREIGAAVSLGCRDGLDMIYLETIRGARMPHFLIGDKSLDLRIVKPITNSEINVNPRRLREDGITI